MKNTIIEYFPSFKDSKFLEDLNKVAIKQLFEEEKTILEHGSEVAFIPLVTKGSIRVLREDESGKEILLYYVKPGESCIISIMSSKKNQKSQLKAVVAENTEVILIPSNLIKDWSTKYLNWNDFVFDLYQKRFEELIHVVDELAFNNVDQRLVEFITKKITLENSNEINMTHQEIADELGTAREVVSRLLKKLEVEQKVKLKRGKIEIGDNFKR